MKQRCDIAVILVGMNTRDFVRNFLDSLATTDWAGYTHEVIYVDNASKDDTLDMLRRLYPHVHVIANDANLGFTKAANQAAATANSRYHLQLNNDVVVYPDSIAVLARFLDEHPKAAMVGGRILNPDLTDQWSARRFPTARNAVFNRRGALKGHFGESRAVVHYLYKDLIRGTEPFQVDWVPTVYALIREEAFEEVGGLPESMYYWAETVFCLRLERAGHQTWCVPQSKIIHFEGHGGGPRPYSVKKWHIMDFHRGAYGFFLERHRPQRLSLIKAAAAVLLAARAFTLLAANKFTHLRKTA